MEQKRNWWPTIIVAVLVVIVGGLVELQKNIENRNIKIGVVSALSGGSTSFGIPAANAAQMAVDEINSAGGINGKKISLLIEDGGCDAKKSVDSANKLINVDKVTAILPICSTNALSIAPIAEQNKVIEFAGIATSPVVSSAGDYVFRSSPKDTKGTKILTEYILDKKYKKVAILTAQDALSSSIKQDFITFFGNKGKIVFSEDFPSDQIDFRTELTKIKSSGAQAILFVPIKSLNSVEILKEMKEMNVTLPLFSARTFVNTDVIAAAGNLMNGVIYAEIKFNKNDKKVVDFLKKYSDKFKVQPTYSLSLVSGVYDSVYILKDAIQKCDENTACIKDFLYNLKDYNGVSGIISMDQNGDPDADFELLTVSNGQIVPLAFIN